MKQSLPHYFSSIDGQAPFSFQCHPKAPCFTHCCRELDLVLTPYDVLRLKNRLDLHSGHFLEQYVIIEWDEQALFPVSYLTMVDDGKASCVFVRPEGCAVYPDRPGSCRAYPAGRGAELLPDGSVKENLVLIKEPHCKGFAEKSSQTVAAYFKDQELEAYNRANDQLLPLLQHEKIVQGFKPTRPQLDQFILALYNLDTFRQEIADGRITLKRPFTPSEMQGIAGDDEKLLELGTKWLVQEFHGS